MEVLGSDLLWGWVGGQSGVSWGQLGSVCSSLDKRQQQHKQLDVRGIDARCGVLR